MRKSNNIDFATSVGFKEELRDCWKVSAIK